MDERWKLFAWFAAMFAMLLALAVPSRAGDISLPVVAEHYDAVCIVTELHRDHDWDVRRIYFLRGDRIIAERTMHEGVLLVAQGDRKVDDGPWWNQLRAMTDLAQPPVTE